MKGKWTDKWAHQKIQEKQENDRLVSISPSQSVFIVNMICHHCYNQVNHANLLTGYR
uniref:Uncharacterized protein n=1 Tax=Tetranychus urticae TaxID=32264 RepID=T1JQ98_TETUR